MFIYLIVNHETGKYYVGQHKGKNLRQYLQQKLSEAKRYLSRRSHLYASMRAHPDPKIWSIHALRADIQTREELDQIERDFIKFLRSQDQGYGYNICRGGEGFTGPQSDSARQKIATASKKMWQRPGHKENIITKRKAYTITSEQKSKTSTSLMGHLVSKETRDKISIAKKGQSPPNKGKPMSKKSKIKLSESQIKRWEQHPEKRAEVSSAISKLWSDYIYREHMSKAHQRRFCKNGHDTEVCGRYRRACRECNRIRMAMKRKRLSESIIEGT